MRRYPELYHTSRQYEVLHQELGRSEVESEHLREYDPKDLADEKPYSMSAQRTREKKKGCEPLNNKTYLITLWVGKIAKSLTVGIFSLLSPPPVRLWLDRVEVPMLPTA